MWQWPCAWLATDNPARLMPELTPELWGFLTHNVFQQLPYLMSLWCWILIEWELLTGFYGLWSLPSQAILCRYNEESQKHAALSLSKEHNPTQYEERMRIQKAGGNVRYPGIYGSPRNWGLNTLEDWTCIVHRSQHLEAHSQVWQCIWRHGGVHLYFRRGREWARNNVSLTAELSQVNNDHLLFSVCLRNCLNTVLVCLVVLGFW